MITVILVSVDGKDAYYIHLPDNAGAERPTLKNVGYRKTEVKE